MEYISLRMFDLYHIPFRSSVRVSNYVTCQCWTESNNYEIHTK